MGRLIGAIAGVAVVWIFVIAISEHALPAPVLLLIAAGFVVVVFNLARHHHFW